MPFDREKGEFVPLLGQHDMPIPPNSKWRETKYYRLARAQAIKVFLADAKKSRTAINASLCDDDWFCQTYHSQGVVLFYFQKLIRHREKAFSTAVVRERYVPVPIRIPLDELREMTVTGMWPFVPQVMLYVPQDGVIDFLPLTGDGPAPAKTSSLILP
jgi:hypothetical protein